MAFWCSFRIPITSQRTGEDEVIDAISPAEDVDGFYPSRQTSATSSLEGQCSGPALRQAFT